MPKTLICHDMANGYHDDSVIDGTTVYDAYTFYNWSAIDIFCYFSHHLITIPPLGWINVGHAHGVKVIGTVITEWADGVTFWDKILKSEADWQEFAIALVVIAKTLKFDGWLLNVENKITKPNALIEFVRHLHKILHQELIDPVLIWYDSVTVDGILAWQNGLNAKNKDFFDACDGIFTNYSWNEEHIRSSALVAGDRLRDLYIGLDVWGRNFIGGGQFNTQAAVKIAYKYGCSLAIFAQAWTHEAMAENSHNISTVSMTEGLSRYDRFMLRDRAFWGSLWPYLNTKLPTKLPFQTSFCRGQGKKRRLYGEVVCPGPWYNLRHMHYQPHSSHGPHGYILSTPEYIKKLFHQGILKDKTSMITYRRQSGNKNDFYMTRNDIEIEPDDRIVFQDGIDQLKSVKRKMKESIKSLFKIKSTKVDDKEGNIEGASNVVKESTVRTPASNRANNSIKIRYALAYVPWEQECMEVFLEDSFIGGSCLKINPSDEIFPEHRIAKLFHTDFKCENTLIACVVTKNFSAFADQFLDIQLFVKNANGENMKVVLVGQDQLPNNYSDDILKGVVNLYPINSTSSSDFGDVQRYLLLNEPGFYVPVENYYGWKIRYYEISLPGSCVTSVNCSTGLPVGSILLGHFGLCQRIVEPDDNFLIDERKS